MRATGWGSRDGGAGGSVCGMASGSRSCRVLSSDDADRVPSIDDQGLGPEGAQAVWMSPMLWAELALWGWPQTRQLLAKPQFRFWQLTVLLK